MGAVLDQTYILRIVLFQRFQECILGFLWRGQSEVWYLYLFLLSFNMLFIMEVSFMSVMLDKNIIWRYNRQARSFFNEVVDEIYVSTPVIMCISFCR